MVPIRVSHRYWSPSKVAGTDNLSGKFLKDGAHVLIRSISQLCNLSIELNSFPRSCKIAKVKPLFKKGCKTDLQNYILFHSFPCHQKLLKGLFMTKQRIFWIRTNFCTGFSRVFEKTTLQTLALDISLTKLLLDSKKVFSLKWF